jgi:hypothetical protein
VQAGEEIARASSDRAGCVNWPYYKYQVARIYIQSGQFDRAIDLLEPVLSIPGDLTPAWLRIDPIFAPLRGNPRFDRISK